MLQLFEDILKPGGHAHVFFSSIQFSLWNEALCNRRRVDYALSNKISTIPAKKKDFGYEKKTIQYLQNMCNISQPSRKTLHHVNMSEQAVYFWRLGLDTYDLLQTIDYYTPPAYVTGFRQPRTSFLGFLGYPFQKWCSTWTSRSKILDDVSCFGRSRS